MSRLTFLNCRDQLFFFSWSRFLKLRFFSRDFDASRLSRFVETQSRFVEKSRRIEKSRRENTKIHALLGRDRDKLSRNAENFRSRRISRSRSRQTVEKCRKFQISTNFSISIVETNFLTLSRFSRLSRLSRLTL